MAAFKGNIYQIHICLRIVLPHPLKKDINLKGLPNKKKFRACGVNDTIFALENRSYLGEFDAEFKKALARESGARGVLLMKKT
jgi:hypothetical protein